MSTKRHTPEQIINKLRQAEPMFDKAEQKRIESRHLAAVRDVLLPKVMPGEILIPDADRIVRRCA